MKNNSTRVTLMVGILAIAALCLNLILGYGGLVSFGHAAFLGLGAYAAVSQSTATRAADGSARTAAPEGTLVLAMDEASKTCTHEGREYEPGATVCSEGFTHECDGSTGEWKKLDEPCE